MTTTTQVIPKTTVAPRGSAMIATTPPSSITIPTAHATSTLLPGHIIPTITASHNHHTANAMPHKPVNPLDRTSTSASPTSNKSINNSNNKLAMSRALGAAFLSHQVEQLEKSVSHQGHAHLAGRRDHPRDRDRDRDVDRERDRRSPFGERTSSVGAAVHKRGPTTHPAKQRAPSGAKPSPRKDYPERPGHKAHEYREGKDADLIVLDASVLVHGLHRVKRWCKDGREEIVIVPLEALNTLDLLKKGASPLAQRARSASRILEAQVGTNPRIRVQRDDAFVPWDRIEFKGTYSDEDGDKPISQPLHLSGSPEWVRRMICCARWEVDNASNTLEKTTSKKPQVVLAVLSQSSGLAQVGKIPDGTPEIASPVPLPAPGPHSHKYEPRSAGLLVAHWAAKAGIELLEVEPSPASAPPASQFRNGDDEERGKRQGGRGRHNSRTMGGSPTPRGTGLVERPAAVMQMMEMVAQPSKVVRVLARGEKLEPDT